MSARSFGGNDYDGIYINVCSVCMVEVAASYKVFYQCTRDFDKDGHAEGC